MKILLAVDGSQHSAWSAEFVARLPLCRRAEIHVTTVFDEDALIVPSWLPGTHDALGKSLREQRAMGLASARKLVEKFATKLRPVAKKLTSGVEVGHVSERILDLAEKRHSDLIVVGSRGTSGFASLAFGRVAQRVLDHAPCSVAVVKRRPRVMRRFLLATDGSDPANASVLFLDREFERKKLRGSLVYVWEYPVPPHPFDLVERSISERFCDPLKSRGWRVTFHLESGDAADAVTQVAKREDADLILVGSKGASFLRRFVLGGVSAKIALMSETNVIVVR